MVLGEFLMIWEGKESKDQCTQYRPIVLEEVACKLISSLMLVRLTREVGESKIYHDGLAHAATGINSGINQKGPIKNSYLPVTQVGFRKGRSTRDNSYALRTLINLAVELEKSLTITVIDLKDAFTSVSHALIEEALRDAGAQPYS